METIHFNKSSCGKFQMSDEAWIWGESGTETGGEHKKTSLVAIKPI